MLRKFTVENFGSVREAQTLDLTIGRKATDPDGRFVESIPDSGIRLPTVALIYGANASGKSTVLRALNFVARFIGQSALWDQNQPFPFVTFATKEALEQPTLFRLEVDGRQLDGSGHAIYEYELELNSKTRQVSRERLRYLPDKRPRRLFERSGDTVVTGKDFALPKRDPVRLRLHPGASVVSELAQFAHPVSMMIANAVNRVYGTLQAPDVSSMTFEQATSYYLTSEGALQSLENFAISCDMGIVNLKLKPNGQESQPYFDHQGLDYTLPYSHESQGTRAIYRLYPLIHYAIQNGTLIFLDELDEDIHPNLLPEILRLFQSPEANPNHAQLIASCHDASALDHLMKEEVFFTEKDIKGRTEIFGLKEIRGTRRDENIYAKYLAGAYGAVPVLG